MIPVGTTYITIQRPDAADEQTRDPWERDVSPAAPVPTIVASAVRANIEVNRAGTSGPGQTQVSAFLLVCDPVDLAHTDTVTDERTGQTFTVDWVYQNPGLPGLEHVQAGLSTVSGFGNP